VLRNRGEFLGVIEAQAQEAAEAAAVERFQLTDLQRKRLLLTERRKRPG
jgi:hypothetical protein